MSSRFPCMTPGVNRFSLDFPRAVEKYKECSLELGCGGLGVVRLDHRCMEFVTASLHKGNFID